MNTSKRLNIITVCFNTAEFVAHLHANVLSTIGCPFSFTIVDNGSKPAEIGILENIQKKNPVRIMKRQQRTNRKLLLASQNHAEAIHEALDKFSDEDMIVHLDNDLAFIMNGWGGKIRDLINQYDHVTTCRPSNFEDSAAHFMGFKKRYITSRSISLCCKVDKKGNDYSPGGFDTGSGLAAAGGSWKKIVPLPPDHPQHRPYYWTGQIWTLDDELFMDHLGAGSYCDDHATKQGEHRRSIDAWKKHLRKNWGIFHP